MISVAWRSQLFPNRVTVFTPVSSRERMFGSSSGRVNGRRVVPKAASLVDRKETSRDISKNRASFGLEPGHPPST